LTDLLLIAAGYHHLGLRGGFDRDAFGHRVIDRVREAQAEVQHGPLALGAVTDADQLQLLLEALTGTDHHVVDQGPHGTCHGPTALVRLVHRLDADYTVIQGNGNIRMDVQFERALAAFHGHVLGIDLEFDASGYTNRRFSNTRHDSPPVMRRRR